MPVIGSNILPSNFGLFADEVPAQISGLELWLDAGVGVTVDGSNNVTGWADQSGNGRDAVGISGREPLFVSSVAGLNSLPGIEFDAAAVEAMAVPYVMNNAANWCVVVVMIPPPGSATDIPYVLSEVDATNAGTLNSTENNTFLLNNTTDREMRYLQEGVSSYTSSTAANGHNILTWRTGQTTGVSADLLTTVDGNDNSTGLLTWSPLDVPANDRTLVGTREDYATSRAFGGTIAEILVYETDITAADLNSLWNYLGTKYAVSITTV